MEDDGKDSAAEPDAADQCTDNVKQRSIEQRAAQSEEPTCVICGRYGEYICDETDDDICSLECKQILLQQITKSQLAVHPSPVCRLPTTDECFYVRDSGSGDQLGYSHLGVNQVDSLRRKLEIYVRGDGVPAPVLSFSCCNIPEKLLRNVEAVGYDIPTPVQMQAIPAALVEKSLLVTADTGSGKTAAFLIPVVSRCCNIRLNSLADRQKPLAVVITPTRELCIQIEEQAKMLGKGLPFKTALVVGGDAMAGQVYRIQKGVELIIGTPGRLIDLLAKHELELDNVVTFVLDEVDCMLQRGFRDQVMQIFRALSQPQVLMYSATVSPDVEKMAGSMVKDVAVISVGKPNRPNEAVKQLAIWVESKQKKQKLFDILRSKQHFCPPVLVYVSSRLGADLLSDAITVTTGIKALSIHGEKPMKDRRDVMKSFLVGYIPIIVSTGVLGRGIDLVGVRQVILFDMPSSIKEYVHQIGRASRMSEQGSAIVFVNEEDKVLFPELIQILKSSGAVVPRELANSRYAVGSFACRKDSKKRRRGG